LSRLFWFAYFSSFSFIDGFHHFAFGIIMCGSMKPIGKRGSERGDGCHVVVVVIF
jgi:hypothetical protein